MTRPIVIREEAPGDARAIAAVHAAGWRWAYAGLIAEETLQRRTPESLVRLHEARIDAASGRHKRSDVVSFVAEDEAGIVGFAVGGSTREQTSGAGGFDLRSVCTGELYAIYIERRVLGSGAGSALLDAVMRWLAGQGHERVGVWVLESNARGRAFYERRGARLVAGSASVITIEGERYTDVAYVWQDLSPWRA